MHKSYKPTYIMKQLLFIIFAFCLLTSCNERVVQLPETTNEEITEVIDVSPVYMFYDEETDSVEFNRRNMISSTNWLVNIDKRLTLKQVLPHLQYLQKKRQGDGMHKKDNARNYFTCSNTNLKNLSFIEFTDVVFQSNFVDKLDSDFFSENYLGVVRFNSLELIEIASEYEEYMEVEKYDFNSLLNLIDELTKSGKLTLKLSFNSNLSFQDYISIKSRFLSIKSDRLEILSYEIINN